MKYDPAKHHRRSIRLKGYDYSSPGAYFVTICIQNREGVLGEVVGDEMRLNAWGRVAAETWLWLAEQYPHVTLDEWVVMPNHLHGIIVINNNVGVGADRVGAVREPPLPDPPQHQPPLPEPPLHDKPTKSPKPLGRLVGAFKTVSTKHINEIRGLPGVSLWQRDFYDHIIRNERDLNAIRTYIRNNPLKWALDRDNLNNTRRLPTPARVEEYLADLPELILE